MILHRQNTTGITYRKEFPPSPIAIPFRLKVWTKSGTSATAKALILGPNVYVRPYFTAARTQTFIRNLSADRKLSIVDSIASFKFAGSTLTSTVAQSNIFRDWRFDSAVMVLVLVVVVGRGGHVNTFRAWATVKQSKARDEEINTPTFLSLPTETYLPKILRQPDRILSLRGLRRIMRESVTSQSFSIHDNNIITGCSFTQYCEAVRNINVHRAKCFGFVVKTVEVSGNK